MVFQDLSRRFLYTFISLIIVAALLAFVYVPVVSYFIALFVAFLGVVAMWEFCQLTRLAARPSYVNLLMVITAVVVLSFFLSTTRSTFSLLPFISLFLGCIILFLYHFDKIQGCTQSIGMGFFGLLYVAVPLGLLLKILYLYSPCRIGHVGRFWIVYLLVVTKITDMGAYFGGRLLGNKKLAARISPGKTVAGALSGFISAILFSLIFWVLSHLIPGFYLTLVESIWLGAVLGVLGQAGDLAESLLKRDADVKDSNRLPGLGGILDMLDSLLFTTPVIYFFLYVC